MLAERLGGQPPHEFLQPLPIPTGDPTFDRAKTGYFNDLALQEIGAFRVHIDQGLWDREDSWRNVSEHCLVEVARVGVLTNLLRLDPAVARDTATAAALHDYYKKEEKALMVERGLSPEAYTEAGRRSADGLRARGFSDRVVRLAGSIGHDTVPEAEDITEKPELNDEDLAWLAMHSVDEYTSGSDWVDPVEVGDDGVARNDLDRYMGKAKANPRYAVLRDHILTDVDGTPYRGGTEGAYDSQIRVGHRVMEVLTDAIRERNGIGIHPLDLPMYVDNVIKQQILERTDSNAQRQAGEQ